MQISKSERPKLCDRQELPQVTFQQDTRQPGRRSPEAQEVADRKGRTHSTDLRAILGITELPNTDYAFFRDQWVQGTGQWL